MPSTLGVIDEGVLGILASAVILPSIDNPGSMPWLFRGAGLGRLGSACAQILGGRYLPTVHDMARRSVGEMRVVK